ncbi:3'5'-cyclic nucleotide phosphodiesterase family protein [Tritrichomonas foetus]|uniref:3'5'-cyclic nucleotide phosphodiesterase family protein n=1 Tax=Tritrichomonas foetus TaxID=1144522 RepID=A0A1J4KZS5_9EUKA|nr:3'5'-cyclic nucleotide phosphodiesterase family protein [Tritrichomonas foetus]|eukprot:OHT15206.1 3'5'-cyclic nucleotide phosphodiesterase family protein [Tritrichomonas foetus]
MNTSKFNLGRRGTKTQIPSLVNRPQSRFDPGLHNFVVTHSPRVSLPANTKRPQTSSSISQQQQFIQSRSESDHHKNHANSTSPVNLYGAINNNVNSDQIIKQNDANANNNGSNHHGHHRVSNFEKGKPHSTPGVTKFAIQSSSSFKHNLNGINHNYDQSLDIFLGKASALPLHAALEQFFRQHFEAKMAIVWQEIPHLQLLYSSSFNITLSHSSGLVGYSFVSRGILKAFNPSDHPAYDQTVDEKFCSPNSPVVIFPLFDYRNNISYVIEIIRSTHSKEFTDVDESFIEWFARKFRVLSQWLKIEKSIDPLLSDIMQLMRRDKFLPVVRAKIAGFFDCRSSDIFKYDKKANKIIQYGETIETIDTSNAGIVGDSLLREQMVNVVRTKLNNNYCPDVDKFDEPMLSLPVSDSDGQTVYSIVLRGPNRSAVFTKDDEDLLKKAAPFILLGFTNSDTFSVIDDEYQNSRNEREGLAALLEVVEVISSQLNTKKLTELIMEKGRSLTNADRCSLLVVNETRDRLITSFHKGLENCIDIPINKGIAGKTVMEGKALNIADVYETEFFDSSTDMETGYRTKSILSVPIYNHLSEIIGVTEMVNKLNDKPFTQFDMKLIQIYNVFCGISLENAKLYQESLELSHNLRSFFDTAFTMSKSKLSLQRVLAEILMNAKNSIHAEHATILLIDEAAGVFSSFFSSLDHYPQTFPITTGIAGQCVKTRKGIISNDVYSNQFFYRGIDNFTNYKTHSLVATPILSSDGAILGVTEITNKTSGSFTKKDMKTLQAFSTFASIAIENARLKNIVEFGDSEIEMKKYIGKSELSSTSIPTNLQLTDAQKLTVTSLNCFAVDFQGILHFKELFYFFNLFKLLETFEIPNESFFKFCFTISGTYNDVPYHNWTHACDVTQYVTYEIITAGLTNIFTANEIFGLMTAAICHDANHRGFNNIYNVKAQTPFGILFKDLSVMEMHHITVAIPIITRDDINLFHSLDSNETKNMWSLFISLILATDMAHHFELVKKGQGILDEGSFSFDIPENRLLGLQLVLKVADISNVSRPFDIANKWCDILCKEFFRQGDLEKESGIGLTSPLNDRENNDKPKSQIGFYNFICLPLYHVLAGIFPPLQVNVDSVKSNLEVWKSMVPPASPS